MLYFSSQLSIQKYKPAADRMFAALDLFNIKYKSMEDKDKIITSLRKQLKDAISRCNALEQENALLSYQLEKREKECPESR